jgi:hypothetical protein
VQTKGSPVLHDGVREILVCSHVVLGKNVVAFVSLELALRGYKGHMVKVEIGIIVRLHSFDVGERAVDGTEQMVAYVLALGIGVEPLSVFPVVGQRSFIRSETVGSGTKFRGMTAGPGPFSTPGHRS